MIDWQTQISQLFDTSSTLQRLAQAQHTCPNCQEELADGRWGVQLNATLAPLFPASAQRFWCSVSCLAEWIADRALDLARDGAHYAEVAR